MINFIIGGIIILLVGFVVYRIIKNRSEGKSGCADCSGCAAGCHLPDVTEKP